MTSRRPLQPNLAPPLGVARRPWILLPLAGACILENPGFIDTASSESTSSETTTSSDSTSSDSTSSETTSSFDSTSSETTSSEPSTSDSTTTDPDGTASAGTTSDGRPACEPEAPAKPALDLTLAPSFAADYRAYDLGTVPGIPSSDHLGGATLAYDDNDTLLVAGESEESTGKIYTIGVVRGECGHIIGFKESATKIADTPFVGAALAFEAGGVLFYNLHPNNRIAQLLPASNKPDHETDLDSLSIQMEPGGLGFVPSGLGDPGGLRVIDWKSGEWYQVNLVFDDPLFKLTEAKPTATLPKESGGFAYVPAGSPGFDGPQVLVAEWTAGRVAAYAVNGDGDPDVKSRQVFLTTAPRPSGLHFDPVTGDLLLLTWDANPDRIFVIQGFAVPEA